jgi:NADH-quinone oxidoreductase subunit C
MSSAGNIAGNLTGKAVEKLQKHFAGEIFRIEENSGQTTVLVKPQRIVALLQSLKEDPELSFDALQDVCGVDYLNQGMPERFAVVYHLYSYKNQAFFRVKAFVSEEEPEIESVSALWASANWAEREAFDMYGIRFKNHPNLIRILLPEGYQGYPLRKDYPLRGRGEREDFPRYVVE